MKTKATLYQISNLQCAYKKGETVLQVDRLELYHGELVFVVGTSGGGKSTLIETLGLMNQTTQFADQAENVRFTPTVTSKQASQLLDLWNRKDEEISTFRKQHFSFIFQQTNLMPNFSGGENMLMTALLAGKPLAAARANIHALMEEIGLPDRAFTAPTKALSGGQQQRLAFIRALVAGYSVLFGDEPTGNLDEATAAKCFATLKTDLRRTGRSGIIVSHDLDMAVRFADRIIPISLETNEAGRSYGLIRSENILEKSADGELRQMQNQHAVADPITFIRAVAFNDK